MKIIFDTNVLISAFISTGRSYDVIDDSIHSHQIYYTPFLLKELTSILKNKFKVSDSLIQEILLFIERFFLEGKTGHLINIKECPDPNDVQLLTDAFINNIDALITGDKDLLNMGFYKKTRILSLKNYWSL